MNTSQIYYQKNIKRIKEYYQKNKEKIEKKHKIYRLKNKIKRTIKNKEWFLKHLEYQKNYKKKYHVKNFNYHKKWELKNKEKRIKQHQNYYLKNKKKIDKRNKDYYKNNPEYRKKYYKTHPEIDLKSQIKRFTKYAKELNLSYQGYRYALQTFNQVVKKQQGGYCSICGSFDKITIHHLLHKRLHPKLSLNPNNGIPLCKKHHNEVHGNMLIVKI